MNGQRPHNLNDFIIPKSIKNMADLIIIGTQETYLCNINKWASILHNIVGSSYVIKAKKQLGKLFLILFLKQELASFSSACEINAVLLNKRRIFNTKGAISISLIIFGSSFLFITVHLSPHVHNIEKRIGEIQRIFHFLKVSKILPLRNKNKDITDNFDCTFIFGDMNFRFNESRKTVMNWIENTHFSKKCNLILENDQLRSLLKNNTCLKNYIEAPITFPPTYKYNKGPLVKLMLAALKSSGCEFNYRRHVSCEVCNEKVSGGYDPNFNQVVICQNVARKKSTVQGVLTHEMIHMFDYCQNELDFQNLQHIACSEIRAANLAHCSFLSSWIYGNGSPCYIRKRHQECVKKKALSSILVIKNVSEELALQIIDQVFLKCYSDLEPIGRRCRRNSVDMDLAFMEAPLYSYNYKL